MWATILFNNLSLTIPRSVSAAGPKTQATIILHTGVLFLPPKIGLSNIILLTPKPSPSNTKSISKAVEVVMVMVKAMAEGLGVVAGMVVKAKTVVVEVTTMPIERLRSLMHRLLLRL
jgi:hypothetical protein